jgi:hypothetical protein
MRTAEDDLAVLISSLKTRRPKEDPLRVARSCQRLRRLYGSYARVATKVGLDRHEMLREFEALLSLPADVKDLYRRRFLKSVVAGYWISRMKRTDQDKRLLANAVVHYKLTAQDVRDAVAYAERMRDYSIPRVISAITDSKKVEHHYLTVVHLRDVTVRMLKKVSKEKKVRPEFLLRKVMGTLVKPKNILSLAVKGNIVTVRFNERGFKTIESRAIAKNIKLEGLIDEIAGTWLRSHFR